MKRSRAVAIIILGVAALAPLTGAGAAEYQFWAYGGYNTSANSDITLRPDRNSPSTTYRNVEWKGASFSPPVYWGVRGTYWLDRYPGFGIGVDYSHIKVIAKRPPALNAISDHFEFTDGLNTGTFDLMYRYKWFDRLTPYVGAGVGIAVPSVEVTLRPPFDTTPTHRYEFGGPAVQGKVGLEYEIAYNVSAFGEYKIAYSSNDVRLRNGGREQTDIATSQFIFGLSYTFK